MCGKTDDDDEPGQENYHDHLLSCKARIDKITREPALKHNMLIRHV